MEIYKPNYKLTFSILKMIEEISKIQGELQGLARSVDHELLFYSEANIDAVHFSTKIEGNKLTIKQVTQVLGGKIKGIKRQRDLKEILNYSKARKYLFEKVEKNSKLTLELMLETHKILQESIVTGKLKGHLRDAQNVIKDSKTHAIVYMPPEPNDVKKLLLALINWQNNALKEGLSPLIVAPIFHYRFVTIHPFMDGNGRVARLLTTFILYSNEYTVSKYAAIEKQHELNRADYYLNLRRLQHHTFYDISDNIHITTWLEYWLKHLKNTYQEALNRVKPVEFQTESRILSLDNRLQKAAKLFVRHKKISAHDYQTLMALGRTQAVSDLNKLIKQKIIRKIGGGRSTVYKTKEG
ncbi:Fic family protein [bacterium]